MGRRKTERGGVQTAERKKAPRAAAIETAAEPQSVAAPGAASKMSRAHWIALALTLAFVLATRLGMFSHVFAERPSIFLYPDSSTYDEPARALLKTGRFAVNPDHPESPMIVRTPGYPLFIAAHYLIFGINLRPILITQILLSVIPIVVIFLLCLRLRGPRAALIAAILMALEPISFVYAPALLTDSLFMMLMALIAATGILLIQAGEKEMRWAWLLGLAIALSAHLRPINYYLIGPALAGMVIVKRLQGRPARRLMGLAAALAAPWIVLVGGWQLRNAAVAGTTEFSAIQSVNLLHYRAAGVIALRDGVTFEEAQKFVKAEFDQGEMTPAERYRTYRREALKILREHPGLTLTTMSDGLKLLLLNTPDIGLKSYIGQNIEVSPYQHWREMTLKQFYDNWIRRNPGKLFLNIFFLSPVSDLLYLGVLFVPWRRWRNLAREAVTIHLFLVGLLLYLSLISAGPEANFRFRLALIPVLALYSGIGWDKALHGAGMARQGWRRFRNAGRAA